MDSWDEDDRAELQTLMAITPAQTIAVLNHFEIADHLRDGPQPIEQIALTSGTHELTLYRLLAVCRGAWRLQRSQTARLRQHADGFLAAIGRAALLSIGASKATSSSSPGFRGRSGSRRR